MPCKRPGLLLLTWGLQPSKVPPTSLTAFVFNVFFFLTLFTTKTEECHTARPPSQGCPV